LENRGLEILFRIWESSNHEKTNGRRDLMSKTIEKLEDDEDVWTFIILWKKFSNLILYDIKLQVYWVFSSLEFNFNTQQCYFSLSILCSVTVGIIFKISEKYNQHLANSGLNYIFAIAMLSVIPLIWTLWCQSALSIYISLGVLLPAIFFSFLAASTKHMGIVNRCSPTAVVIYPHLSGWLLFKEDFNTLRSLLFS
jgi:hypothetical protein